MSGNNIRNEELSGLCAGVVEAYAIDRGYYRDQSLKFGLRNADGTGVNIGVTKIGSVRGYVMQDGERMAVPGTLYFRGYSVPELVDRHQADGTFGYEEVAYLLLFGELPTAAQLQEFNTLLDRSRALPAGFFEDMILKSPGRDVMNKLASSVLALYTCDDNADDCSAENVIRQSIELIARFPTIVADAYAVKHHHFDGKSLFIHNPQEGVSLAENFLGMLREDRSYTASEAHLLDLMLILHAEHGGGNNSTFACRTLSSSGTDTYSAVAAAVGSLKGPLHGGANCKVMDMFRAMKAELADSGSDDALGAYLDRLLAKEAGDRSGKIYGLGHAVYTMSDPRAELVKKYARSLAEEKGRTEDLELLERVERLGIPRIMEAKHMELPICANVDLYSGLIYDMLGIPQELFTPLFAVARIAGWCAHRLEEIICCDRLIRPAYRYAAKLRSYVPAEERE